MIEKELKVDVKENLDREEIEKIKLFFASINNFSIEQYPGWADTAIGNRKKCKYFIATKENNIVGFAIVLTILNKIGRISFGPATTDKEVAVELIEFIIDYFKKSKLARLDLQLGLPVSHDATFIQYKIASSQNVFFYYGVKNKSTILLDLSTDLETIQEKFAKDKKSRIKQAFKLNLSTRIITDKTEFAKYINGYIKLYSRRKLSVKVQETIIKLNNYFDLIQKGNLGFVLGTYNSDNILIGGLTVVYQNNTAVYYNGFSDPDFRSLPINHIALFDSIKKAKQDGKSFFDFGGYNFFVTPKDQVYSINLFKKGFCPDSFYFFPPIMQIHLKPFQSRLISFLENIRNR